MGRIFIWAVALACLGACAGFSVAKFTTPLYESQASVVAQGGDAAQDVSAEALTVLRSPTLFHRARTRMEQSVRFAERRNATFATPRSGIADSQGGNTIEIHVQSTDPGSAAALVNAIVQEYNHSARQSNNALVAAARADLEQRSSAAKEQVDQLQNTMRDLQEKTGIVSLDDTMQQVATYGATLSSELDADGAKLVGLRQGLAEEQAKYRETAPNVPGPIVEEPNPQLQADIKALTDLQAQRVQLLGTFLETSSEVRAVDAKIAAIKTQIAKENLASMTTRRRETQPNPVRQELAQKIASDEAEIASLQASVSETRKAQVRQAQGIKGLPADEAKMLDVQRELDLADAKYKALRAKADGTAPNSTTASMLPTLSTVLGATPSDTPVWPDYNLMMSVGAAVGLLVGLVLGASSMPRLGETTYQQPAMPGSDPALTGMAAPPLPTRRGSDLSVLALGSTSPAETYRFMAFSMLSEGQDATKTVLFTGVSSDRLCSEAAAQFAIAVSRTGVRTLLADCNLRHQNLTEAFGFDGRSGISDMLSRTMLPTPGNDLVLETQHVDLFFLPCGSEPSEGLGDYQNLQITGLVQELSERADVKVLNTPACSLVSDAPRLARFADTVCLVASRTDRSRGLVSKAADILKRAGAKEIEVLVIDADVSKESFLG